MAEIMRERIGARLRELSYSANFVSEKAGLDRSVLGKFLSGKVSELRDGNLRAIAQVLRVDPSYLRGETEYFSASHQAAGDIDQSNPALDVDIVGIVEAGAFRPVDWFEDVELGVVANGYSPQFGNTRQFGFLVRGDSMDLAGISDGDEIVCIDPWEAGVEIGSEDWVVVENNINGGHTRELTVKELQIHNDHWELSPRSSNRRHLPIIIPRGQDLSEEGREVRIVGIVIRVVKNRPVKFSARLEAARKPAGNSLERAGKTVASVMAALVMCCGLTGAPCDAHASTADLVTELL